MCICIRPLSSTRERERERQRDFQKGPFVLCCSLFSSFSLACSGSCTLVWMRKERGQASHESSSSLSGWWQRVVDATGFMTLPEKLRDIDSQRHLSLSRRPSSVQSNADTGEYTMPSRAGQEQSKQGRRCNDDHRRHSHSCANETVHETT